MPLVNSESTLIDDKYKYRHYSRQVFINPNDFSIHRHRIDISLNFQENEPLQGALVDLFYGCWYDIPYHGDEIISQVQDRLQPRILNAFQYYVDQGDYVWRISELATRWSVLVMPSLDVAPHRLRISSDDARSIAKSVSEALLQHREVENWQAITDITSEFLNHCLACDDAIAFSIVWFRLAKSHWQFDNHWEACRQHFEQKITHK